MMEKCRYYNNCQCAAILMLDDFSLTATVGSGQCLPATDWGALLDGDGSLYRYLEDTLLKRFPEVKGTLFYPIGSHALQNEHAGYSFPPIPAQAEFRRFLERIAGHFELAFHGICHGRYRQPDSPCIAGNWQQEFAYRELADLDKIRQTLEKTQNLLGIRLTGGKYPGYQAGKNGEMLVERLGFEWWASSAAMMNRRHLGNRHGYIGSQKEIVDLPTNLSGNCFRVELHPSAGGLLRQFKRHWRRAAAERHLQYLYQNGLLISIQEHYMGLRTDGRRQLPNVFDDLVSLETVFAMLRGANVWYASCGEVADYLYGFDRTQVTAVAPRTWEICYTGRPKKLSVTFASDRRAMRDAVTGRILTGIYKNGRWLYHDLAPGFYQEL